MLTLRFPCDIIMRVMFMPRTARKESSTGFYHVLVQGVEKNDLFQEKKDRQKYLEVLKECREKSGFSLIAYSLFSNHVHLLIHQGNETISDTMKRVGSRYVGWFNLKYGRSGPLFRGRFASEPVENEAELVRLMRYIHSEPVYMGLCEKPDDYLYTSYRDYFVDPLIHSELVASLMDQDQFADFHTWKDEINCLEAGKGKHVRLTDEQARKLVRKVGKVDTPEEFAQILPEKQEKVLKKLLSEGVSIRQAVRFTGSSFARVRKYTVGQNQTK